MSFENHPNPDIHAKLVEAAAAGKLDSAFIESTFGPSWTCNHGAAAYVNWDCTLALLGPAKAREWFAGVSKYGPRLSSIFPSSPDEIRDTRSAGTSWVAKRADIRAYIEEKFVFTVEQTSSYLLVEVYSGKDAVAVYTGTPAEALYGQLVPAPRAFRGLGLWSMVE